MPEQYFGTIIPSGGDLAYAPAAFKSSVDNGNFVAMFANQAARDAWVAPGDGALAWVRDTNVLTQYVDGAWRPTVVIIPIFATVAARDAAWPAPPNGAIAQTTDTGTTWFRRGGVWTGLVLADLTTGSTVINGTLNVSGATAIGGALVGVAGIQLTGGVLAFPGGHNVGPLADGVRVASAGAGVATMDVEQNRVRVTSQPPGNAWSDRTLVVQKFAGTGEVGIGFFNHMGATGGSIQLYTPPAGATEFYFVNANNSGGLGVRASAFNVISSRTVKEDIQPAHTLDLTHLEPVTYHLKGETRERYGLIAEDVADVSPLLSDGQAIDLAAVLASLVGAVKDLTVRIAALETP